jgi:ATP-binding cassette, subfamily B (MDR/TAP), member 1
MVIYENGSLMMSCGLAYKAIYGDLNTKDEVSYKRACSVEQQTISSVQTVLEDRLSDKYI